MSSSSSRSRSRSSRSRSESRDSRRRSPRSGRHSGSGRAMRRDCSRSRRGCPRSKGQGTPHHHHSSHVPVSLLLDMTWRSLWTRQETRTSWRGPRRASPGRRRSRRWTSPTFCPHLRSRTVRGSSTSPPPHFLRSSGCT